MISCVLKAVSPLLETDTSVHWTLVTISSSITSTVNDYIGIEVDRRETLFDPIWYYGYFYKAIKGKLLFLWLSVKVYNSSFWLPRSQINTQLIDYLHTSSKKNEITYTFLSGIEQIILSPHLTLPRLIKFTLDFK